MAKSSPRVKSDKANLTPVTDWQHADQIIRNIAQCQGKIKEQNKKAIEAINKVKSALIAANNPLQERIKCDTARLEAFALSHKDDFKKQKSRKLNFGVIGWRKSTAIKIKKTTLELIKKLFTAAKAKTFIRTKETVDKEALAKLNDNELALVGARRDAKEVFFVEPDLPKAVDYYK